LKILTLIATNDCDQHYWVEQAGSTGMTTFNVTHAVLVTTTRSIHLCNGIWYAFQIFVTYRQKLTPKYYWLYGLMTAAVRQTRDLFTFLTSTPRCKGRNPLGELVGN